MSKLKRLIEASKGAGAKRQANFYVTAETLDKFKAICKELSLEYSHVVDAWMADFVTEHTTAAPVSLAPQPLPATPPPTWGGQGTGTDGKGRARG